MKKFPPLTPFLISTFFVLVNHRELQPFVKWEELVGVWLVAMLITGAVFGLVHFFVKDRLKAALLSGLIMVSFCFYGDIDFRLKWLLVSVGLPALAHARYLLPVIVGAFLLSGWLILRKDWPLLRFKAAVRVCITAMVVSTLLLLHLFPSQFVSRRDRPREVDEHGPFLRTENRPDIYYILLDCYTGSENLKKFWDYDNAPFTSFLEANGFFVVPNARANYDATPRCLASALNMAHIKRPPADLSAWGRVNRMCEIIDLAAAPRKLQEIGYEVVNLSLFDVAGLPQHYQVHFLDNMSLADLLRHKSLAGYAAAWWQRRQIAEVHQDIFDRLKKLPAESDPARPRFIYAHILAPHWPYVFNRHGLRPDPLNIGGAPQDYLEQLIYVNQLVTNVVGEIRSKSKTPPIIILQGDHGFRFLPEPNQRESASKILNAYYLPGGQREWVYEGITPVNSFRMIFNHYFGAHYPRQRDEFYHGSDTLPLNP